MKFARIKELLAKETDGTITDAEKTELDELQSEVDGGAEGEGNGNTDGAGNGDEGTEEELGKEIQAAGVKMAQVALAEFRKGMAADAKKAAVNGGETADKGAPKPVGKELVKQFFVALFEKDNVKLDSLSTTAADGGYLIPTEFADDFVAAKQNATVMRAAGATVIRVSSSTFSLPILGNRPKTYWTNELAAKSSTSASFDNLTLTPYVLAAIMTASNQVIADAKIGGNLIEVVTKLMSEAIAFEEDRAFFVGSGTGQPTGLTGYTVTTYDALGVITGDTLISAVYKLRQPYRKDAAWFMNSRTLSVVRQLKDNQNRYIFENALDSTSFPTLLGRPVYEVDDMASNEIWFGDARAYWIADREDVSVRVSDEATVGGQSGFERNFTAIRVEERVDGELADTKAFVEITNVPVS